MEKMKRIKTIIVSLFCVACLVMPSMPVMAANPVTSVKIGSATLNSTNMYYHNGENGAQGEANDIAVGANAEFDAATGTLTLNGLDIKNTDSNYRGIFWEYSYSENYDLVIVLESGSTNSVTNTSGTGINGNEGFADGPSLTIKGSGILNVNASGSGIWVWENITIQDDVVLNVTSTGAMGIANNSRGGKITIKDNAKVTTTGDTYGIGCSNGTDSSIIVDGGSITSSGGTAAFFLTPDLSSYAAFTMNVGNAAPGEALDEDTVLTVGKSGSKYCKIAPENHFHAMAEDAWKSNNEGHYYKCSDENCNVIGKYSAHTKGAAATANTPQTCTVCNYEITPALGGGGNSGGSVNPGGGGNEGGSVAPGGSVNPGSTGTDSGSSTKKSEKTPEELYMKKLLASAEKVKPGNTMVVDASDWHSFRATALNELTDEKGVSYTFYYKYRGECFYLTVPAGTVFDESIPWYGPYKMNEMFGRTMIDESTLNAAIKK